MSGVTDALSYDSSSSMTPSSASLANFESSFKVNLPALVNYLRCWVESGYIFDNFLSIAPSFFVTALFKFPAVLLSSKL